MNSSKTFVSDVNNPSKHDSNLAMENGNVWNECDPSVPDGWKTRTYWKGGKQKTHYLSPDGTRFKSLIQIYSHLLISGYSDLK